MVQTSEKKMKLKELNKEAAEAQDIEDDIIYRIDIPANRYDMLCLEGIARALNIFQGRLETVQYRVAEMQGKVCLMIYLPALSLKSSIRFPQTIARAS